MENAHTISSLTQKRAEIAGQIEQAEQRIRALIVDLDHVDAALRLFDPTIDLQRVRNRPPPQSRAFRGEISSIAMGMFKEAGSPLTSGQIVERVMISRGLNPSDLKLRTLMIRRICALLSQWRRRNLIRESGQRVAKSGEGAFKAWVLVHREAAILKP